MISYLRFVVNKNLHLSFLIYILLKTLDIEKEMDF